MKHQAVVLIVVAAAAAGAGYVLSRALDPGPAGVAEPLPAPAAAMQPAVQPDDLLGQQRPDFTLRDANGKPASAGDFDGKILLLNFWASWCRPCVDEMPMLSDLQRAHAERGLQVVGIALDDPQRAQAFAKDLELAYPLLYGLADAARVGRLYGNGGGMLPYSVLVDARGIVRWTQLGSVTREQMEVRLADLR
jgi:peroxiredoxin